MGVHARYFEVLQPTAIIFASLACEWTGKLNKLVPDIIYVHSARRVSLEA